MPTGSEADGGVTLRQLAEHVGLSTTTVSDALSGTGRVAESTRQRVMAAAQSLGYRPNPAAQHLRKRQSGALGLYLPPEVGAMQFYMELTFGVLDVAAESGYDLTLLSRFHLERRPRVDGIIVADPLVTDPLVRSVLASGLPVVAAESYLGTGPPVTGAVDGTHHAAMTELLDHLESQGAQQPILMAPDESSSWAVNLRAALRDWCHARGVEPTIVNTTFTASADEIVGSVSEILDQRPEVDAIVCAPDGAAIGVVNAARNHGRVVGGDLLVASCVDSPAMSMSSPPITSVDLRASRFGRACCELLVEILNGTAEETRLDHALELRLRESTGVQRC